MQVFPNNVTPNSAIAENEPGYGQLLAILIRRRFWVLGGLIACLGIAALYSLRLVPNYVSNMQLLVEPNYQGKTQRNIENLENEFADTNVQVDTATQINLMKSSGLLKKAMAALQAEYPDLDPTDPESVAAFKGSLIVSQITREVSSRNQVETKIFQVFYTDTDPIKTQQVLQELQKVYLDYNLEQQRQRLKKGLEFVNKQIPQIQAKVSSAEAALERFRTSQELIDPETQAKEKALTLNQIQQEQQKNRAELQALQTRFTNLQRQVGLSPQQALLASRLSQSTRYQSLLNEIQKTELELVQQRLRFKDGTPYVQKALEQRQRQLALLQAEVTRVVGNQAAPGTGGSLLSTGQLGELDINLVNQLIETQVNLRSLQARYQSLATIEQQLRTELQRYPSLLAEYGRLLPEVELNRETLKQLLKAQQDIGLEIARGGFDWQVVEEPQLGTPTGPGRSRNLLLGAVAGLMLGGVAAFVREAMDDAVHSSDDLKKQLPVPLLGMVPALALAGSAAPSKLNLPFRKSVPLIPEISSVVNWKPFRESLDLLYQNIQLLSGTKQPLKSLVVTSALAGEGKSTLILGLAMSAARLHQRVLVIDADLRRPSLHKLLNLPNDRGLSTLLASHSPIPGHLDTQDSSLRSNISVITAGPTPTDPAKLLSSQRMREVMARFENTYDLVLMDVPPVLGMVDAILAASCCEGVLMVGRIDQVTKAELAQAAAMLSQLNVIGMVANGATHSTPNEGHYYHSVRSPEAAEDSQPH